MWRPAALWLVVAVLAIMFAGAGEAGAATARAELKSLAKQVNALPARTVSKSQRRKLRRPVLHARRVMKKRPCAAVKDLARFRKAVGRVKVKRGRRFRRGNQRLAALGPASLETTGKLLARKGTKRCGGGTKPSTRDNTKTTVLESDENGMKVRVQLPELQFVPRTEGGQVWTELKLPNTDAPAPPGKPGIPVVSSTFGVPDGATLEVNGETASSYTLDGVDVFPAQPDPVDDEPPPNFLAGAFADQPFTIDSDAYETKGLTPAEPAGGQILGQARDIVLGNLQVPAVQYDPLAKKLKVLKSVLVTINFNGGSGFNNEVVSPWEAGQHRLAASLLNGPVLRRGVFEILRRCGEEMLVITNPATRVAADQFAAAKRAAGMRTSVFEVGAATAQIGTTAAQIQSFIRGRLTRLLCIHPSYVTIMGDDDLVPTFAGINGIPSDLQYSMRNDTDELPDVAVGRIIGNDQAAVASAVTKIVNYETSPPTGPMLTRATIAAQFQDDDNDGRENRTFIQFAETVRNGLAKRGVAVDRIYGEHPGNNPQKFNDGTDLPAALKKPTFGWNGTGAQVSTAWNEGRFLMIHRDHGWSDGWGTPGFGTANVQALTNGALLPVVMSINCSSGAYDYDETSFAGESLVKSDGGSVGVFGDTRDSPSWHNTQIALGFVDGLLPSVLPAEGPAFKQRTGDALITGKLRLAGLSPPATDGSTRNELYLWHYFGDPSMQMWGGGNPPLTLDLSKFTAIYKAQAAGPDPDPPPYLVEVGLPPGLNGQAVSLLRNGDVIGKATIADDKATIPAAFGDGSVKPGELQVVLEADGAAPVTIPVSEVPKVETTLTQSCPTAQVLSGGRITVTGTLSGAPAGSTVNVEFKAPGAGRTVLVPATTDAGGNWSAFVDTQPDEQGSWQVKSSYAGDSQYAAASGTPCTVAVKRQTNLTQSCPANDEFNSNQTVQISGTLAGAPAGSTVDVEFKTALREAQGAGRTVVTHPVTNSLGQWTTTLDSQSSEYGNWTVKSTYAGSAEQTAASTEVCTFHVADNS